MRPSLHALTIGFLVAFLIATAGTGIATYALTLGTIERLVDRRIENIGAVVGAGGRNATRSRLLARIDALAQRRDTGDIGFLLTDLKGTKIGGNINIARRFPIGYSDVRGHDHILGLSIGRAFARPVGDGMILTTIAETEPFDGYHAARVRIYQFGFGSIIIIVLVGVFAFAMTIARRLAETRHTVDAIIAGNMQRRVAVTGSSDEFDRQAHAFNRMLDRIAELMDGLRNVSSDVAHDLRAPMARLRSRLAKIARTTDAVTRVGLDEAIAECDAILAMFGAILRIAEIETGERTAGFANIDLADLVTDVAEAMAPVAEETGHGFKLTTPAAVTIVGDARLIEQALVNGIENAMHHTPPGTTITLTAMIDGHRAIITIGDDGPGIASDQHDLALRRFGRLEASRNQPGHGLGLPLMAAILRLHGGTLTLEEGEPGLLLKFAFPLVS